MVTNFPLNWDLNTLFKGGSSSKELAVFIQETARACEALLQQLKTQASSETNEQLTLLVENIQDVGAHLADANSFVSCLTAQNMNDKMAIALQDQVQNIEARYTEAIDLFQAQLASMKEQRWQAWICEEEQAEIAFSLTELRDEATQRMAPALEAVAAQLAVDGYQAWGKHYMTIVNDITIPYFEEGKEVGLSAGQAFNKLNNLSSPVARDKLFRKWEEQWSAKEDMISDTLNHLAGFRLKLYGLRNWTDFLQEPLKRNRMTAQTLNAMWTAVTSSVEPLTHYLNLKAKLLGKEKLGWQDLNASISKKQKKIPFDQAAEMIIQAFARFSPNLASFAEKALAEGWIEAEDRPGKQPGGFCTGFPTRKISRIYMTYSGSSDNIATLAHELGHAYHSDLLKDCPLFAQEYAMNVAETASTFAEALVTDALLEKVETDEQRLVLLDEKLAQAVSFCMDIRSRYLFEQRFYAQRKKGLLDASNLNKLMVQAQQEAFGNALGQWHPHFWATKLHFYGTDEPFYNFPYTFGYLFSTGLLAIAEQEGSSFHYRYDQLLQDTGKMSVEQLAYSHLGINLEEVDFWQKAVHKALSSLEAFTELAKKKKLVKS